MFDCSKFLKDLKEKTFFVCKINKTTALKKKDTKINLSRKEIHSHDHE